MEKEGKDKNEKLLIETADDSNLSWLSSPWFLSIILILTVFIGILGNLNYIYKNSVANPQDNRSYILEINKSTSQFKCPSLSSLAFYDNVFQYNPEEKNNTEIVTSSPWVVKTIDYSTNNEELFFINAQKGYKEEANISIIYCGNGEMFNKNIELLLDPETGRYNSNYTYCGNFINPIVLYKLDSTGNIINETKTSVQVIFDSKTKVYISTRCGTYSTLNAP